MNVCVCEREREREREREYEREGERMCVFVRECMYERVVRVCESCACACVRERM